jgi:catechol 2,3-dioxygenase
MRPRGPAGPRPVPAAATEEAVVHSIDIDQTRSFEPARGGGRRSPARLDLRAVAGATREWAGRVNLYRLDQVAGLERRALRAVGSTPLGLDELMVGRSRGQTAISSADLPIHDEWRAAVPPLHEIAHLGHVELRTPVPEKSLEFFTNYLGLTRTGAAGDSVFLRAWDDYENTTIKLTGHRTSGVGRTNLRASSPDALERRVTRIEEAGRGIGWQDGDPGYGPTYVFTDPDGHEFGLYYESEWYRPPAGLEPALKNQAQAYPSHGVGVRRLDHVNWLGVEPVVNRDFLRDVLGAMVTEQIVLDDGTVAGSWTTFTNKGYDAVYTRDRTGTAGRLHHIAFAVDTRDGILRAADVALEQGVHIETGPHKHAIQQTFFLYVYEPGGNRIELCNAGARLVLAPDWQPVNWTESERAKGQAWGLRTIDSFHTHGTPPVGPPELVPVEDAPGGDA